MPQPTYRYWAGPWDWRENAYQAPAGAFTLVDLRPVPLQSTANHGAGMGSGLFVTPVDVMLASEWTLLGEGFITAIHTDNAMRSAWQSTFGVLPQGDYLVDYLAYTLTDGADPDGFDAPKPVDVQGGPPVEAVISLKGHSPVWRRVLDVKNSNGRWGSSLRKMYRTNLERIATEHHPDVWRKVLGARKIKHGQRWDDPDENAWVTNGLKQRGKANGKNCYAMRPTTQNNETWPTNGAITSGQDFGWAMNSGPPLGTVTFSASSGLVSADVGNAFYQAARCTDAVSSEDHWTTAPLTITSNYAAGTCVRMNATNTFYFGYCWYNNERRLRKFVAGTETALDSDAHTAGLSAIDCKTQASASTITCQITGYDLLTVIDTTITGNLLGGIMFLPSANNNYCWVGATTIDDGASAGGQPLVKRFGGVPYAHSLGRGVW